ncbi:cytidine deaminase [Brucepastera parasyntrophica]|uniref:cytidine deaminase n=1 Tax=Brucepastera parasyntrophica TaxID=2880008 RepID=UPI00210C4841|nr:cytidine deaminase [Brucepastera parasyntrophica]ULQ59672.1 cytidine deaminase [Brucepastera parasyntrophica]
MKNAIDYEKLFNEALRAASLAYAPYSRFRVGAALLLENGDIITGVNVENRSFGVTNCAERSALFAAVSAGFRSFRAIAVATPDSDYPVSPCGVCRQALSEFMPPETPVIFGPAENAITYSTIGELYPYDALHELAGPR